MLTDTTWIADWNFDRPTGTCSDEGWSRHDSSILNDGTNHWSIRDDFSGTGGINGNAAVLSHHDLAWVRDGYGNDWDYAIILTYQGASTLTFDYLSDSEPEYDFFTIEVDSLGVSEARVDYAHDASATASSFRRVLFSVDGMQSARLGPIALPDFGIADGIHEVYLRFTSDVAYSDADGEYASQWNAGLVIDNLAISGMQAYTEDFEGVLHPSVTFANTAPSTPFGQWGRLYPQVSDNDLCTENRTCAWLWSDPALPAYFPDMAFGPDGVVVRHWLDNSIVSPWVSLAAVPDPAVTMLSYRLFGGQNLSQSRIMLEGSLRSKVLVDNSDTPIPGDSVEVVQPWRYGSVNTLGHFSWRTSQWDLSNDIDPGALAIQVRFRVTDWQRVAGWDPPEVVNPGPGPYLDRVRIGRCAIVHTGPEITARTRAFALDGFPSEPNSIAPGENFSPTTDRFGTSDFAASHYDLGGPAPGGYTYNTTDSIWVQVEDVREAGISEVTFYGAIVEGPHVGKAPPPWTVEPSGFFRVPAQQSCPNPPWACNGPWFIDLDDDYFRGGDVVVYFWAATDGAGGLSSLPAGLAGTPSSIAEAEQATGGLWEVAFLPTIDWDPLYLERVAAHPSGQVEPTPEEIANSRQRSPILYVWQQWHTRSARRRGPAHRSAFMYTLDQLGYKGLYDVYFQSTGHTYRWELAGRATVEQATGYSIIIHDSGKTPFYTIPDGFFDREAQTDQVQWYRDWLTRAAASEAQTASLWVLGDYVVSNAVDLNNPLVLDDMGVNVDDLYQTVLPFPNVAGQTSFGWADGDSTDFSDNVVTLNSSHCRPVRNSGLEATGTAVVTHRYALAENLGDGAVIMNANSAEQWNTILMPFTWEDVLDPPGVPGNQKTALVSEIFAALLADSLQAQPDPATDTRDPHPARDPLPSVTQLFQNAPNPFNPTTVIRFDLARDAHVNLAVYDVAGRLVRQLVRGTMPRERHEIIWNGLDRAGRRVASGIYLYHLSTPDLTATRKMVVLR